MLPSRRSRLGTGCERRVGRVIDDLRQREFGRTRNRLDHDGMHDHGYSERFCALPQRVERNFAEINALYISGDHGADGTEIVRPFQFRGGIFRGPQQFAIVERVPTELVRLLNGVMRQERP